MPSPDSRTTAVGESTRASERLRPQDASNRRSQGSKSPSSEHTEIEISIHLGSDSDTGHDSRQSNERQQQVSRFSWSTPSDSEGKAVEDILDPADLRKHKYAASFRKIQDIRDHIDQHTFSDVIKFETDLLPWSGLNIVEKKAIFFYVIYKFKMLRYEHDTLQTQAQAAQQGPLKLDNFVEMYNKIFDESVDLNMESLGDSTADNDPRLPQKIIAVAIFCQYIKARNQVLLEEATQWSLLVAWRKDKVARLKYRIPDDPPEFHTMYICPRLLKEMAVLVRSKIEERIEEYRHTLNMARALEKETGRPFSFSDRKYQSVYKERLQLVPEGYVDIFKMDHQDIRNLNLEGEGVQRIAGRDLVPPEAFMKSLALRTRSLYQIKDDISKMRSELDVAFAKAKSQGLIQTRPKTDRSSREKSRDR